ncbi:MAG: UbiH/UbiF/VisC/COQ6 family ubiquinone biosynthesis hydroxylase [Pseudomonadales bacterium]|nr:UbiH/UbiF/VisC/COQ6 family ubiquinone biosynthesis hydroxylase [Pseudomonadales bacterium]
MANIQGDCDIVITGGGMVGLSLACALADSHLSVVVLEAGQPVEPTEPGKSRRRGHQLDSGFEPRVSAINLETCNLLQRTGVWEKCETERFAPLKEMLVWDARGTSRIEFGADMIDEECLGYIAENHQILLGLTARVRELDNVDVHYNVSVQVFERIDDGYRVVLNDEQVITCRLLVGADGGNSRIREMSGMKTFRWNYDQQAFVTTVQTERPHGYVARQSFTPLGPLAFLPLANDKLCSIVWSTKDIESLKAMSDESLCRELGKASEFALGEVKGVDRRYSFPLYQQHAMRYTHSHLALIGDAAHTIHPLAGQGANLGFADANALAIELCQCRFSNLDPGDGALLRRFERRRKPDNLLMASIMEAFKRIYDMDDPRLSWIRNSGMRWVQDNDALKARLVRFASGSRAPELHKKHSITG